MFDSCSDRSNQSWPNRKLRDSVVVALSDVGSVSRVSRLTISVAPLSTPVVDVSVSCEGEGELTGR